MPNFGAASRAQLATCDPRLQRVLNEAIQYFDFVILEGHRGEVAQEAAFTRGFTKLHWPHGNHNATPSRAADCAPFPVDWSDTEKARERFAYLAGVILVIAKQLNIPIRWGGDWNKNQDTRDEGLFRDYPHFELIEP